LLDPSSAEFAMFYGDDLDWAIDNVPFFEASDGAFTEAFAFRWKLYKRHTVATPGTWNNHAAPSFVVTEFDPAVKIGQAGAYNTISCAAMHHINEGRWLRNRQVMEDYGSFWLRGTGQPRRYSFPAANSLLELARTHGTAHLATSLLPELVENFEAWKHGNYVPARGLFYQTDTADGGEDSISGSGLLPSINFAMIAEQRALGSLFLLNGNATAAQHFNREADALQHRTIEQLWSRPMQFFGTVTWPYPANCSSPKYTSSYTSSAGPVEWAEGQESKGGTGEVAHVRSRCAGAPSWPNASMPPVRELYALSTPYYFRGIDLGSNLSSNFSSMWPQLMDSQGFSAHWGPRTAERRSPLYNFSCDHACLWNAPSWPFETARVASALANYITETPAGVPMSVGRAEYWSLLTNYTRSIVNSTAINPVDVYGKAVPAHPWVGEDIHPDDGHWLARAYMVRTAIRTERCIYSASSSSNVLLLHASSSSNVLLLHASSFSSQYADNSPQKNRGWMYNHATYCDNILHGLVGIRSSLDTDFVVVHPLVPEAGLRWFAADGVSYHSANLTIFWDADGTRYNKGAGLHVWVNGEQRAREVALTPVKVYIG
jgi:hypothetical protein